MTEHVHCVVIGAGVVGLAVAREVARGGRDTLVLERHNAIGTETSARNSEVIHAGIYYPRASLKAKLCVAGKGLLYRYCEEFAVPYDRCGKLIVACREAQVAQVRGYIQSAQANGVKDLTWLDRAAVGALEPQVQCIGGVLSPSTGIIDSHAYILSLQGELERHGGMLAMETEVLALAPERQGRIRVHTPSMDITADWVVNCAGLYAGAVAGGLVEDTGSFFAKGHYYVYSGKAPFSRLVYPVAEPGGLGVHVTRDLGGQVKFGPDVQWVADVDYAFDDTRFDAFVAAIRDYFPSLEASRLHPGYTGIRPKIAGPESSFNDFVIAGPSAHGVRGFVNLRGIESPGLTASLAIAAHVHRVLGAS